MSDDLRAIVFAPLLHESPMARYRPPSRKVVREGVILHFAQPPHSAPNFVTVMGATPLPRVLDLVHEVLPRAADGYELIVDVDLWRPWQDELLARGFRPEEEEPALVLPAIPATMPSSPPELDIRLVTDEAGLRDFFAVSQTAPRHIPSLACATDPGIGLLVGYVDGRPVATARLTVVGGTTDINGVLTLPEHRRRGYGTAMTWAAVAEGGRRGATSATLTATDMGYPVYVKMGFITICTLRTYVSPSPE